MTSYGAKTSRHQQGDPTDLFQIYHISVFNFFIFHNMISTTTTTDHSSRVYNINNNNNRQPFKKVLIFFKEKVAVVTVIVAVKAVEAAVAVDVVGREPLHYGIRADIF